MRLLTAIYAVLALAFCLWLAFHWKTAAEAEPRSLLDEARRSMAAPDLDYPRALVELGLALDAAEAARDMPLVEEILTTRARLLRTTGGFSQARADLERVLTHFRPGSAAVEALLAGVDLDAGEVESALARASAVIDKDRGQIEAWAVRAEALLRLADRKLQAARSRAGSSVTTKGRESAEALMRRIAVLAPDDRERVRLVDELFDAFPVRERETARDVMDELDDASRLFAEAPEALARSFDGPIRTPALQTYTRLLADAGEVDDAIQLGLCLTRVQGISWYTPFLRDQMTLMVAHGRARSAQELVAPDLGKRAAPDATFFGAWAEVLYRTERWAELASVANYLRGNGDADQRVIASYYLGVAQAGLNKPDEAVLALQRFVAQQTVEPFAGALTAAWGRLAQLHRDAGRPAEEVTALRRALSFGNDTTPGMGELWRRAAELSWTLPGGNRFDAVDELAHALRLMPAQRTELEALWRERGQRIVEGRRIDLDAEARAMVEKGLSFPEAHRCSFDLVRIAEICSERGEDATALVLARRILEMFPGLPPAIERAVDGYSKSGNARAAAELLRLQAQVAGATPASIDRLLALGAPNFGADWRVDMVRFDPEGIGRRWAAEALRERGDTSEAIAGLQRVPDERLGDDGRLLLAEMLFDSGREAQAQAEIAALTPDVVVLARALPLSIHIGVRQRDAAHISKLIRLLGSKTAEFDSLELLECVDHMLRAGLLDSARELCAALDERPRTRSAALYLRMAAIGLLSDDLESATEALERALPYDEGGGSELGQIIIDVRERRWSALKAHVRELQESGWEPTTVQYIAAAALSEHVEEARLAARDARAASPEDPLWPLIDSALDALRSTAPTGSSAAQDFERLHGFGVGPSAGTVERDPRPILARLVALGHPEWSAWAVADLDRSAPPLPGSLWPTYLASLGHLWVDDSRSAELAARKLTAAWPTFAPAWDVVEEAIELDVRKPDHPRLLRLAEQRRAALGASAEPSADFYLAEARLAEQAGNVDAALAAAQRALQIDPQRSAARRKTAQLHRKRKEWALALDTFHQALERAEPESDSHPVREMLDLLAEVRTQGGMAFESRLRSELDFLSQHFPSDPLVALSRARQALLDFADDRRAALLRVRAVLEEFRSRTENVPFDSLRSGCATEWIMFLGELDPDGAHRLAEAELLSSPASVELWRAVGRTAERLGLLDRALDATETAERMLPEPETALRCALLSARRGDARADVQRRIDEARRVAGASADERRLSMALLHVLVRGTRAELIEAVPQLARLWQTRDAQRRPEELVELGKMYGCALIRRGDMADRNLTHSVFQELLPRVSDPSQRNLLTALTSLSLRFGL